MGILDAVAEERNDLNDANEGGVVAIEYTDYGVDNFVQKNDKSEENEAEAEAEAEDDEEVNSNASVSPPPSNDIPGFGGEVKDVNGKSSRISTIAVFGGSKKRIVLKRNLKRGIDEFAIDALNEKIKKKFAAKGLGNDFLIQTDQGFVIEKDEDVARVLSGYDGELVVVEPDF